MMIEWIAIGIALIVVVSVVHLIALATLVGAMELAKRLHFLFERKANLRRLPKARTIRK